MAKELQLKTRRLRISPIGMNELEQMILPMEDGELRKAYSEMLEGCRKEPQNWLWYTPWRIALKDGTAIGDAGFKGNAVKGAVEIGYGLKQAYEGKGYMTEAARALMEWAFAQEGVYAVEAETEADNRASQRVLEKLGFVPHGEGEEGPRFVKEKPQSVWMPIYMCLGISVGTSLGASSGNLSMGMCMGIAVGLAIGAALDSSERKKRKEITGR